MNCDLGSEEYIVNKLLQMDEITSAHLTFGAYDIIAEISAPSQELLESAVATIRSLSRVVSTMTLNVMSSRSAHDQ